MYDRSQKAYTTPMNKMYLTCFPTISAQNQVNWFLVCLTQVFPTAILDISVQTQIKHKSWSTKDCKCAQVPHSNHNSLWRTEGAAIDETEPRTLQECSVPLARPWCTASPAQNTLTLHNKPVEKHDVTHLFIQIFNFSNFHYISFKGFLSTYFN